MNNDLGKLLLFVTLGFILNVIPTVQKGRDAAPVLIANLFLFIALAAMGAIWRYDVAKMLAGLYLLSSFLFRGVPVVTGAIKVLTSFNNSVKVPGKAG